MKRFVVVMALALPFAVAAQQGPHESEGTSSTIDGVAAQAAYLLGGSDSDQLVAETRTISDSSSGNGASPSSQNRKPQTTNTSASSSNIMIGGNHGQGGYLDDAFVGSEVRVRFDAAFNDQFPDRAEFFYGKCGCYRSLAGTPISKSLDPNAPGPGPGVPRALNFQELYLRAEYAPKRKFSLFVEVPFRWIQLDQAPGPANFPSNGIGLNTFPNNLAGLSDIQAGAKFAVVAAKKNFLTVQMSAFFPSGNAMAGLGTNHYSIQPEVLYHGIVSNRTSVEGQFAVWVPIGGSAGVPSSTGVAPSSGFAGSIVIYGIGASYKVYNTEKLQVAPVLEMVGWYVLSGFETNPASPTANGAQTVGGTSIVNLKAGFRFNFGRNSVYVGYGHAVTHATWYEDIFRAEYRIAF
jgi:hypothetical protein